MTLNFPLHKIRSNEKLSPRGKVGNLVHLLASLESQISPYFFYIISSPSIFR